LPVSKPVLKAPSQPVSKLKYDKLLSSLAIYFNLRYYIEAALRELGVGMQHSDGGGMGRKSSEGVCSFGGEREESKQKAADAVLGGPGSTRAGLWRAEKGALDTCGFCDERSPGEALQVDSIRI